MSTYFDLFGNVSIFFGLPSLPTSSYMKDTDCSSSVSLEWLKK